MNLKQYSDVLDTKLCIEYVNRQNKWTAFFKGSCTKDPSKNLLVRNTHGTGFTPDKALNDYAEKLRGLVLVLNHEDLDHRSEQVVPNYIVGV